MESAETPHEAVCRELMEELSISIHPQFFRIYAHEESWGSVERNIFYAPISETADVLKSMQKEGDNLGFFSMEEMRDLAMNQNHHRIIQDFFESEKF